jgi:hypothetical protein
MKINRWPSTSGSSLGNNYAPILYPGLNVESFRLENAQKHTSPKNKALLPNKRLRFGTELVSFVLGTELKGI